MCGDTDVHQWLSSGGDFALRAHLAGSGVLFDRCDLGGAADLSGQRSSLLLNVPERTGQPHDRERSGPTWKEHKIDRQAYTHKFTNPVPNCRAFRLFSGFSAL